MTIAAISSEPYVMMKPAQAGAKSLHVKSMALVRALRAAPKNNWLSGFAQFHRKRYILQFKQSNT